MRNLAEFVMKGRREAILAVVLLGIIPLGYLVSSVVLALLILRKGLKETMLIIAWALLPVLAWALYPVFAAGTAGNFFTVGVVLAVCGLAVVLRATASWQMTLLATVVTGLLFELYLYLQPVVVDTLLEQITLLLEQSGSTETVGRAELITLVSASHMAMSVLLLMWSRWLQSLLFNPGGFKTEFQSLRIEHKVALPLVLLLMLSGFGVILPEAWQLYFMLPLLFSGTALVHATVALKKMSPMWLFAYYMVLPVIVQFLILIALADSWFDFRNKMRSST